MSLLLDGTRLLSPGAPRDTRIKEGDLEIIYPMTLHQENVEPRIILYGHPPSANSQHPNSGRQLSEQHARLRHAPVVATRRAQKKDDHRGPDDARDAQLGVAAHAFGGEPVRVSAVKGCLWPEDEGLMLQRVDQRINPRGLRLGCARFHGGDGSVGRRQCVHCSQVHTCKRAGIC
jgi:hypothetical protein